MTISVARTKFIVNIEFFKNQNPYLKDNSSRANWFWKIWSWTVDTLYNFRKIIQDLQKFFKDIWNLSRFCEATTTSEKSFSTSRRFWKILESLAYFEELLNFQKHNLGPPGVFEKNFKAWHIFEKNNLGPQGFFKKHFKAWQILWSNYNFRKVILDLQKCFLVEYQALAISCSPPVWLAMIW